VIVIDLVRVYDVHTQARERLLDLVRPLAQEAYTREFLLGLGTLRATLVEIANKELWLAMRLRGEEFPRPFGFERLPINEIALPTFADLEAAWRAQWPHTRQTLLETRDWDQMIETVIYDTHRKITLRAIARDIATQILLHEVHHRAQAMAMLRHLGRPAEDLDFILFVREREESPIDPGEAPAG
jgi:uncharacterized damage-inducible protein DinB